LATKQDLVLAKRLLGAGVLSEDAIKAALKIQEQWLLQGRQVPLEHAIYASKALPQGALALLSAPPLLQSQPFANYRLDRALGEGGLAIVYAGVYTPNDTPVAVKVLDPVQALRDLHRQRFIHEAKLHIQLEHENLVAGYEVGVQGGYHFYTMDYLDGATALDVIDRRGRLSNEEALSVTLQVARALDYLHGEGLIHRDIKPGNIMVQADGTASVLDLGLVGRMGDGAAPPTGDERMTVGTVEYLSPEQARGRADLDARADLYSLGMSLYHMVVGEVAFQGESDYEVMAQQILSSMDGQKIKRRDIDPQTYFLIAKMSSKDRDERWSSAAEAVAMIEAYLPGGIVPVDLGEEPPTAQPVGPPAPAPTPGPPTPRPQGDAPIRRRGRGGDEGPAPRRTRPRRFR